MPTLFNVLAILFALVTAGAYWYGVEESLFWAYHWYDIMLHLMGGLAIGAWASAVALRLKLSVGTSLLFVFCIVLVVVCVWEVFEYVVGLMREEGYVADTLQDIFNGLVGALVVWALSALLNRNTHVE